MVSSFLFFNLKVQVNIGDFSQLGHMDVIFAETWKYVLLQKDTSMAVAKLSEKKQNITNKK